MDHYVVVVDWADGYEQHSHVLGVAHSLEEAKKIFAKNYFKERKFAEKHNFAIIEDIDTDFEAGLYGFYMEYHTHLYIQKV
jgi:hypothetical protein